MPSKKYYDVDAILAEEELVPCSTNFDFSYLSHLDPDLVDSKKHYLSESTRIKMPLWAIEKWATLGYVRLSLPRHFGKKARERLEADPSEVDLRYVEHCDLSFSKDSPSLPRSLFFVAAIPGNGTSASF
jgi:hypothetical protein